MSAQDDRTIVKVNLSFIRPPEAFYAAISTVPNIIVERGIY